MGGGEKGKQKNCHGKMEKRGPLWAPSEPVGKEGEKTKDLGVGKEGRDPGEEQNAREERKGGGKRLKGKRGGGKKCEKTEGPGLKRPRCGGGPCERKTNGGGMEWMAGGQGKSRGFPKRSMK